MNIAIDVTKLSLKEKIAYIEQLNSVVESVEKDTSLPISLNKSAVNASVGNLKLIIEMRKQLLLKS